MHPDNYDGPLGISVLEGELDALEDEQTSVMFKLSPDAEGYDGDTLFCITGIEEELEEGQTIIFVKNPADGDAGLAATITADDLFYYLRNRPVSDTLAAVYGTLEDGIFYDIVDIEVQDGFGVYLVGI